MQMDVKFHLEIKFSLMSHFCVVMWSPVTVSPIQAGAGCLMTQFSDLGLCNIVGGPVDVHRASCWMFCIPMVRPRHACRALACWSHISRVH